MHIIEERKKERKNSVFFFKNYCTELLVSSMSMSHESPGLTPRRNRRRTAIKTCLWHTTTTPQHQQPQEVINESLDHGAVPDRHFSSQWLALPNHPRHRPRLRTSRTPPQPRRTRRTRHQTQTQTQTPRPHQAQRQTKIQNRNNSKNQKLKRPPMDPQRNSRPPN